MHQGEFALARKRRDVDVYPPSRGRIARLKTYESSSGPDGVLIIDDQDAPLTEKILAMELTRVVLGPRGSPSFVPGARAMEGR